MNIIFAGEAFPKYVKKTIFLAGPSPREDGVNDWRNDVVEQLKEKEFDGTLYIPIPRKRFLITWLLSFLLVIVTSGKWIINRKNGLYLNSVIIKFLSNLSNSLSLKL